MDDDIQYLNTDLELVSATDLTPLATALEAQGLMILNQGKYDDSYYVDFETDDGYPDPETNIAAMVTVIEALAPELQSLWQGCSSRRFDIGYRVPAEAGDRFHQELSAGLLSRLAAVGASVRITIYPPRFG